MHSTPPSLLVRLHDAGDEVARKRFVDYCAPFLFHWSFRFGASRQDAVDFVQDIFVLLFEKLPEFQSDPKRTFRGWLFVTLKNEWLKRKRKGLLPLDPETDLNKLAAETDAALEETEFSAFVTK